MAYFLYLPKYMVIVLICNIATYFNALGIKDSLIDIQTPEHHEQTIWCRF